MKTRAVVRSKTECRMQNKRTELYFQNSTCFNFHFLADQSLIRAEKIRVFMLDLDRKSPRSFLIGHICTRRWVLVKPIIRPLCSAMLAARGTDWRSIEGIEVIFNPYPDAFTAVFSDKRYESHKRVPSYQ